MKGLRARDDVGDLVGEAGGVAEPLDEAHVGRHRCLFGPGAHLLARLHADYLVGAVGPHARREPRAAAEIDYDAGSFHLRGQTEEIEERTGRRGAIRVITGRKVRIVITRFVNEFCGRVRHRRKAV